MTTNGAASHTDLPLTWRVHLAARYPAKAWGALLAIAATVALGYVGFRNWAFSLVAAVLLLGAAADFFFPLTYRLDESGAHVIRATGDLSIPWARVRRCYVDAEGVKLSPLSKPSRLERWRGVYLRFADNEEVVTELVKQLATERETEPLSQETGT